jgi:hypothetical protein
MVFDEAVRNQTYVYNLNERMISEWTGRDLEESGHDSCLE